MSEETYRQLREICLALPEAVEKPFGGHDAPAFRVRDKIFANVQTGHGEFALVIKGGPGAQEVLVDAQPDIFFPPPYSAHQGWIGVRLDALNLDWDMLADLIRDSYRLIAPKRLAKQLDPGLD